MKYLSEKVMKVLFLFAACTSILAVVMICIFLFASGVPAIGKIGVFDFLLGVKWKPLNDLYGILPMIIGSIYVTAGAVIIGVPIGILSAIFMARFCPGKLYKVLKPAIELLAGIPSIVYGLFGLGAFVLAAGFGTSILAGSLTLGIMTMPVVISTAEEAIHAVPQQFRTVSLSLGASKWQTIRHQVLPHALPGMLTGMILGLSRAAGETAPILFTVAAFYVPTLPTSIFDQTMALPYHLYVIATQVPGMPLSIQYGTALVLLLITLTLTLLATAVRTTMRRRRDW